MRNSLAACLLAVALPAFSTDLLGDPAQGETLYRVCKTCHQVGPGAKNRMGPHLNGVFGRAAGAIEGFRYSKAMIRAGADGVVWDVATLDAFIEAPKSIISRTRMKYPGLEDPRKRADLLAYLRTFSDNPSDIPEAEPTVSARELGLDPAILTLEGDAEWGEYLASECTTCHKRDGADDGIPSITQWPAPDFVIAMHAYKEKKRPHPVMQMMAGRLSNEEIAALAAYFQTIE